MSDQTTHAKIELTAEVRAAEKVRALKSDLDGILKSMKELLSLKVPDNFVAKLQPSVARESMDAMKARTAAAQKAAGIETRASRERRAAARAEASERQALDVAGMAALRARFGFQARMQRQRAADDAAADRQRRTIEAATMRDFRERMAFATRMNRQRIAETREAERAEAAATRTRLDGERRLQRERDRSRRDVIRYGRQSFTRGRDAVREIARPPAAVAAVGAAGAAAGARRVLRAEGDVDAAEINARIYGGLSADTARKLRDYWAAPLAESLGAGTDSLLNAYVEATKVGIPAAGAKAFAELATKTSEAWAIPFDTVTDTLGTVNSILTSKGASFDIDKLKLAANALQHLAAKQSTTPEKLISFLKRGAGGADVLGMSMESALAFGSASTSLGNQAGQSGSLLDYIASRVVEMPKLVKQHGIEGREAKQLLSSLGYGSAQAMDAKRRQAPDDFLPDLLNRFNRIKDPKKQEQSLRFFFGREWIGEGGRMVKGIDTYREAVKLSKEARGLDAIGAVWDLHRTKLAFVFKQFRSGWLNILGEFGKILSPMARQAGDVFLAWTSKLRAGGLAARFKASIDGLIEGLGFRDLPDLLTSVLGRPGDGDAGAISTWKSTFREFGAGLRDIFGAIKSVIGAFTGGSPEVIARWTGRILAFSAALVALGPVMGVLGGLISGVIALTTAKASITAAAKLAGLGAGAGAGAGGIAGAAFWATAGGLIGTAFLATIADKLGILKAPDTSKGWGRGILEFLDPGIASRIYGDRQPETGSSSTWSDPPARVQRQSSSSDWRGNIVPAAFSPAGDVAQSVARLERALNGDRARLQLAAMTGSTASAFSRATSLGGGVGAALGQGGPRTAADGWVGPRLRVPGGFNGGAGGGSTVARGNLAANQQEAFRAAREAGLSETAARALVANMSGESLRNPADHHWDRKHMSQGIVQWDPQRAGAIQRQFGKLPKDMTVSEQTRAAIWEMRSNPRFARTWQALQGNDHGAMLDALVRNYEVPANPEKAIRERTAFYNGFRPGETGKAATGGQFDGLRVKSGEATAGGGTAQGVTDLARAAQADLPGGVKHFGAFNDRYHAGTGSKHAAGLAFDTTLLDPSKSAEAAEAMRAKLRAAGLADSAFRVIDEYRNPSARSTGGHLHTQFNTAEAAAQYSAFASRTRQVAKIAADAGATVKRATDLSAGTREVLDGMRSTGWKPAVRNAFGGVDSLKGDAGVGALVNEAVPNAGDRRKLPLPPRRPTAADLAAQADVSPRPVRLLGAGGAAGGVGGTSVHAPVTINAGSQSPAQIADSLQRHVAQARSWRTHDLEPELT